MFDSPVERILGVFSPWHSMPFPLRAAPPSGITVCPLSQGLCPGSSRLASAGISCLSSLRARGVRVCGVRVVCV